jgi:uncharacterized paraquat-inducible protein A
MNPAWGQAQFAVGEWAECPQCGIVCDAPFRAKGSEAEVPEVVLGQSLPEHVGRDGAWSVVVSAICPRCGAKLEAEASFESKKFVAFSTVKVA